MCIINAIQTILKQFINKCELEYYHQSTKHSVSKDDFDLITN